MICDYSNGVTAIVESMVSLVHEIFKAHCCHGKQLLCPLAAGMRCSVMLAQHRFHIPGRAPMTTF